MRSPMTARARQVTDFGALAISLVKLVNSFGKPIAPAAVARQEIGRRLPSFPKFKVEVRHSPQSLARQRAT